MASRISTKALIQKVRQFILTAPDTAGQDELIKNALVMADRELHSCDSLAPLAWDVQPWDGLRTVAPADISNITAASPGVVTAASGDSDVSGHGFPDDDTVGSIVYLDGIDGTEELNDRLFRLVYIDEDTFSLKSLDGRTDIDTSSLTAYSDGGKVVHVGAVLNGTTILSGVTAWGLKEVLSETVTFDGYPSYPMSPQQVRDEYALLWSGRPDRVRYWQNIANDLSTEHILLWYGAAGDQHNVAFDYVKEPVDFNLWSTDEYPAHPAECHEYLWHGALAHLVGANERAQRASSYEKEFGAIEVLFAQKWGLEWEKDKNKTRNLSARLATRNPWTQGVSA